MDDDTDCDDFDADEFDRHILTKQGLLSVIEQLRGRVSHRWQFETLKSYMVGLVNCYGVYQSHPITAQAGLTLCRVRHLGSRETPSKAKELGAREPDNTNDHGRCHWPRNPLCYCSLYEHTALAEVGAVTGQRYVVATYQVTGDLILLPIGELD